MVLALLLYLGVRGQCVYQPRQRVGGCLVSCNIITLRGERGNSWTEKSGRVNEKHINSSPEIFFIPVSGIGYCASANFAHSSPPAPPPLLSSDIYTYTLSHIHAHRLLATLPATKMMNISASRSSSVSPSWSPNSRSARPNPRGCSAPSARRKRRWASSTHRNRCTPRNARQ